MSESQGPGAAGKVAQNFVLQPAGGGVAVLQVATDEAPHLGPTAVEDFRRASAAIHADASIRAVVLAGGKRHFCSGAPRETLLGPNAAEAVAELMSELPRLLLGLPVPTVSALAGHAVGGGWMFGLWSDVSFHAEESLYSANFLSLGITPGMGATALLPELLGGPLAWEVMLSARTLKGSELKRANAPLSPYVRPWASVNRQALGLAGELAALPAAASRMAHQHLARGRRAMLDAALEAEVAMHRALFAMPETQAQLREAYAAVPGQEPR